METIAQQAIADVKAYYEQRQVATPIRIGQRYRGHQTGKIFVVTGPDAAHPPGFFRVRFEVTGDQAVCPPEGFTKNKLVGFDWRIGCKPRPVDGLPDVCLKCGGNKRTCRYTCEDCWRDGGVALKGEWDAHTNPPDVSPLLQKEPEVAKPAVPMCALCSTTSPAIPPGMTVAALNQDGICWACYVQRDGYTLTKTVMAQSLLPRPLRAPLRLAPYDNSVAGIGVVPRIWRLR